MYSKLESTKWAKFAFTHCGTLPGEQSTTEKVRKGRREEVKGVTLPLLFCGVLTQSGS
jgi:hypothetical protein